MVGDVKQSIYRFRLAEPQRFLTRAKNFREKNSPGQVIDLRANFRSRAKLIDAINAFFERVMSEESVDIEYDQSHRLVRHAANLRAATKAVVQEAFGVNDHGLAWFDRDLAG